MNSKLEPALQDPEGADSRPPAEDPWGVESYIRDLGQRVRGARARRGMTRKDLSLHSEISQRYLAQVETGQANISVSLLSRIAQALNLDIHDLLPPSGRGAIPGQSEIQQLLERLTPGQLEQARQLLATQFAQVPSTVRGVALVGLRGGGKSTLGRLLSARLDIPFVRLGNVIESLAGMDIPELFARHGQDVYRRMERQAVEYVLESYAKVVLETGGSLVSERDTYSRVINTFYTVWIQASPGEHMSRVIEQGDLRPIKGSSEAMDDLKLILEERRAQYEMAHYSLDTTSRGIEECLQELVTVCGPYCSSAARAR